jgi:alpha-amylase/alpha-mannosidase (GH57 family)
MSKFKFNPRIIVTINNDNITVKGLYIDYKENQYSINKSFNYEYQAFEYLDNMRYENNCEFSIQVNRINWSK